MDEEQYTFWDGEIPGRVMFVQAFGHGPVYYRVFGNLCAYCSHPGCGYRGPQRTTSDAAMADAVKHLERITGKAWQEL